MKTIKLSVLITFFVIGLSACLSEWAGDSATLVISLGEADRAVYNPYDSKTHDKLEYKIVLTSKIETLNFSLKGGSTFEVHVAPGDWNVWIVSYMDGDVYAAGSRNVTLKFGVNYESIDMYEAHLVKFVNYDGIPDQIVFHNGTVKGDNIEWYDYISYVEGYEREPLWYMDRSLETPFFPEYEITKSITLYRKLEWDGLFPHNLDNTLFAKIKYIESIAVNGGDYTIYVYDDGESFTDIYNFPPCNISCDGKTVSITLKGEYDYDYCTTIYSSSENEGSMFTIEAGVTLKLDNITLDGTFYEWYYRDDGYFYEDVPVVKVNNGGTLVMQENSFIKHEYIKDDPYPDCAKGVFVNGGTFIMNGGEISRNFAIQGGGVYVDAGGTFTMNGGEISNNEAKNSGGAVYVNNGTFTMKSGRIYNNYVNQYGTFQYDYYNGGGVYVADKGTFIMEDGEIYYNGTNGDNNDGGGVYVSYKGTFTMKDGKIYSNFVGICGYTPVYKGGGVYVAGTFTMEKGEIFYHKALLGGGVFVDNTGIFNMKGGNIYGNNADYYGGGVNVMMTGTFTKSGGTISGYGGYFDSNTIYYDNSDFIPNAVYVGYEDDEEYYPIISRNITAGPNDSLSYNGKTGLTTGVWK